MVLPLGALLQEVDVFWSSSFLAARWNPQVAGATTWQVRRLVPQWLIVQGDVHTFEGCEQPRKFTRRLPDRPFRCRPAAVDKRWRFHAFPDTVAPRGV